MPFSVRLDPKLVNALTKLAVRSRRPVSDVVREAVEMYIAGATPVEDAMTAYDRMAHLIGRVATGNTSRSVGTGRRFTALLRERRRARRAD